MITAKVQLTQPLSPERQFAATTGSEHHMLLDDAAGGTGPKPIELVAVGLAGCTAFDVITVLRQKYHQKVTGYKVQVEADQAGRPPQVFTAIRIHHVVTGYEIDPAAIEEAIRLSEEKSPSQPRTLVQSEGVSRFARNAFLISLLALLIPRLLLAQQTQQPSPISLQQAVHIALEKNP